MFIMNRNKIFLIYLLDFPNIMLKVADDEKYMKIAIEEAIKALEKDEVPVGAVIVNNGKIIAKAHNLTETLKDPTAHAEMQAITAAANFLGSKYLTGCTIYVTVEPCPMCAGALAWSQAETLVYGTPDEKKGFTKISRSLLHPKTTIRTGILENDCKELITDFFKNKRKNKV